MSRITTANRPENKPISKRSPHWMPPRWRHPLDVVPIHRRCHGDSTPAAIGNHEHARIGHNTPRRGFNLPAAA